MFLKQDYGDRALGLLGALAVLACGIVLQEAPAPNEPLQAAQAVRPQTLSVEERPRPADSHCDEVC